MPTDQPQQFVGSIVEAGSIEETCCQVIIETTPEQLKQLGYLPFYEDILITLAPMPDKPA